MHHKIKRFLCGFTLIELLTSLLILGILLGTVALKAFPDEDKLLQQEAQKLALLLSQAHDEALTSRRTLAWSSDHRHYEFWWLDQNREWQNLTSSETFRPRNLPVNVTISNLTINQNPVPLQSRVIFSASGINPGYRITLTMNQQQRIVTSDGSSISTSHPP